LIMYNIIKQPIDLLAQAIEVFDQRHNYSPS
jgi:hypothetical protein